MPWLLNCFLNLTEYKQKHRCQEKAVFTKHFFCAQTQQSAHDGFFQLPAVTESKKCQQAQKWKKLTVHCSADVGSLTCPPFSPTSDKHYEKNMVFMWRFIWFWLRKQSRRWHAGIESPETNLARWRERACVSMGSRKRLKEVKYCAHERKERERCVCVPFLPHPNKLPPFALVLTQNNTANTQTHTHRHNKAIWLQHIRSLSNHSFNHESITKKCVRGK